MALGRAVGGAVVGIGLVDAGDTQTVAVAVAAESVVAGAPMHAPNVATATMMVRPIGVRLSRPTQLGRLRAAGVTGLGGSGPSGCAGCAGHAGRAMVRPMERCARSRLGEV